MRANHGGSFTAGDARDTNSFGLGSEQGTQSFGELTTQANYLTYTAITTAMMGAMMFGIDQGNYGLVQGFSSFYDAWCKGRFEVCDPKSDDPPAGWTEFLSWGGSLITVGAAVGSLTLGPIVSTSFGRRLCISLGGWICFVGCLFASFMSFKTVGVFYCGRFITGFGVGVCCFALPMYNSEVATPAIRGLMGSLFQFLVVVGGVIASLILAVIKDWRIGMMLPGVAGAIVGLAIWLTPESPRWTMDHKGFEAGVSTLQQVRRGNVDAEAQRMKEDADAERVAGQVKYIELFTKPGLRKRFFVACWLQIGQQLTGVNAFLTYTTEIFKGAGIPKDSIPVYAIFFNLAMVAGCLVGLVLIDSPKGGRRTQLWAATVIMGPALVVAGLTKVFNFPGTIAVVMLFLYGPGYQIAWGLVPWIYPAEIFLMSERDRAVSLAVMGNFTINFIVNYATPPLLKWSSGGSFLIFGAFNLANFLFVIIFVKETLGRTIEENVSNFDDARDLRRGLRQEMSAPH